MKKIIVLMFVILFFTALCLADDDVEKIMKKLKGQESQIEPPDSRTVQQIFEGLGKSDKSKVLTKVVDESLTRKLWDEIKTDNNRKELIKAGLTDQKSRELLDVWDKIKEKRDFILKKMDESGESDTSAKQGFDKFTEDYIKRIGGSSEFEWKDLSSYTLDYHEKSDKPELVKVNYLSGLILSVPLSEHPQGLQKIIVENGKITYNHMSGGRFVVNVTDMMPIAMGDTEKWTVIGFLDLAKNPYDVMISFGKGGGVIETIEGGFIIKNGAYVEIDDRYSVLYNLFCLEQDNTGFIVVHDNGIYVFRGNIVTVFGNGIEKINFSELTIDKGGVLTDFSGLQNSVSGYESKYLRIKDDNLYGGKILNGNFNLVLGRRFTINSDLGIDFELETIDKEIHSGHLVKDNSLVLQSGFINAQRAIPGASDVFLSFSRVGTTLVDLSGKRGSNNLGKNFKDYFSDVLFMMKRIFNVDVSKIIVDARGYFS